MGNFSFQTGNIGWIINEDDDEREREKKKYSEISRTRKKCKKYVNYID